MIFNIVAIFVILLYFLFMFCYYINRGTNSSNWVIKMLSTILTFLLSFMYIPLLGFLISIISCNSGVLTVQPQITCWGSSQAYFISIGVFSAILLILFQFVSASIFFVSNSASKNELARWPSCGILLEQIVKTSLVLISLLISTISVKKWLIGVVISVSYSYIFFCSIKQRTFLSHFTELVFSLCVIILIG